MGRIAIVTDSNSGITQTQAEELGVYVIPMPFYINEKMCLEGVTLTQEEFYEKLKKDEMISTSQPSPADLCDLWDKLLRDYEEIVHIPMSSGLSASCSTAMGLAIDYNGRVQVVDNQRISVTQRQSVIDARMLAEAGKSAAEIKKILTDQKFDSSIYITLDTLKYLKKGGRITPAAAAIGTVLNLKPVLQIQGEKLDAYAKVRGKKQAKRAMLKAMKKDWETRFSEYVAAVVSFGINSGAYVSEVIRGGILSVDKGQSEAGRSLGLGYKDTMRFIIIPQAVKTILPAMGNEFIQLIKETSILGYVGIMDLTKAASYVSSRTYQMFIPLIVAGIMYYLIVKCLSLLLKRFERRLRESD